MQPELHMACRDFCHAMHSLFLNEINLKSQCYEALECAMANQKNLQITLEIILTSIFYVRLTSSKIRLSNFNYYQGRSDK
jgi:hypothetical protein